MSDTEKILMIFSSKYEHDGKEISSILELDGLLVDIQVNPSRKTLERLLFENQYMCIIPCEPTIISGTSEYNVFRLLDALGFEYYGNNYITNLVLQDKTACLKLSGIGCPTKIITKFRYESDLENCITTIDSYPVFIEPFTSNVRSTTKKYIAHKKADVKNILNDIFSKDDFVDEALVQKQINGDELTVTVVGNSPYNINILTPIKSELENNIITEIISKAYELFNKLSLRDIAHFKFLISKELTEYYLIDISGTYLPSNVDFYNLKDDSVSLKELISSFTIVYLERTKRISNNLPRVRKLLNFLGKPKREKLLSLESKIQLKDDYTYEDVCNELKGRILMVDESNKYDFIKLIEKALKKVPKPVNTDSPFLGNQDLKYAFLDKYNELPLRPQNYESILKSSVEILNGQIRWHSPSVLYNVFPPVMFNTIAASAITNLYNPNAITHSNCAGFLDMEKQIVKQLSNLIGWNPDESAGVFTQGGKFCLTYAIKCGLNRCLNVTGNEEKPIVITSEINHYAIELSSFQLGIPKSNCIRIPINSEGTIDFKIFEKVLRETVECNIPIACIIFSGGNTTHCTVENILKGKEIIKKITNDYNIGYDPYTYYDLVLGWPWLFYKEYDFKKNILKINHEVLDKIIYFTDSFKHSHLADGIGIDFHKGGFSPLNNSLFLSKKSIDLFQVSGKNVGDVYREPNNYTFNNSRGTTDIISAWNILQSVGIQGFQSYVANMVTVTNTFIKELPKYGFEILVKEHTYGFATIVWAHMPTNKSTFEQFIESDDSKKKENEKYLFLFSEYLKNNKQSGHYVRFLPDFKPFSIEHNIAVISVLPMTLHINRLETIVIAEQIGQHKLDFDLKYLNGTVATSGIMPQEVPK